MARDLEDRASSRGRGVERSRRSARPEARRPDTDPSDDRRLPVGSSTLRIDDTTHPRALGDSGLSRNGGWLSFYVTVVTTRHIPEPSLVD